MTREPSSADPTGLSDDEGTPWLNPSASHLRCPVHGRALLMRNDNGRLRIVNKCCDELVRLCRERFVARIMET